MNILDRKESGKAILQRVFDALIASPDAFFDFKGGHRYTPDETANWEARQTIARLFQSL